MIAQGAFITGNIVLDIITIIIVSVIIFIIGIYITNWMATRKEWDDSFNPAIILNLFWLVVNIILYTTLNLIYYGIFLAFLLTFSIHLFIGSILVLKLYKKDYKVSLLFVFKILVYLLIIGLIVGFIVILIISLIIAGLAVI